MGTISEEVLSTTAVFDVGSRTHRAMETLEKL